MGRQGLVTRVIHGDSAIRQRQNYVELRVGDSPSRHHTQGRHPHFGNLRGQQQVEPAVAKEAPGAGSVVDGQDAWNLAGGEAQHTTAGNCGTSGL